MLHTTQPIRNSTLPESVYDDLAEWAQAHLVNRGDAFGQYWHPKQRSRHRNQKARTVKRPISHEDLVKHFRGDRLGHLLGLHTTSPGNTCRWVAIDVDQHGKDERLARANRRTATAWYTKLRDWGFHPLLLDSNGRGGFHLWIIFREPIASRLAYDLGHSIVGEWHETQIEQPEVFPKQPCLEAGRLGNFLRLPGRHHTLESQWSRGWNGRNWLSWPATAEQILSISGDDPGLVAASVATVSRRNDHSGTRSLLRALSPPTLSYPVLSCVSQGGAENGTDKQHPAGARKGWFPKTEDSLPNVTDDELQQIQSAIHATQPSGPGQRQQKLFTFARHLLAIPRICHVRAKHLEPFVRQWWELAKPFVKDQEWLDSWIKFTDLWDGDKVRVPKEARRLEEIVRRARSEVPVPSSSADHLRLMAAVCRHAQEAYAGRPFPLDMRSVAVLLGWDKSTVCRLLHHLISTDVIHRVSKGHTGRASEYRFIGLAPMADT